MTWQTCTKYFIPRRLWFSRPSLILIGPISSYIRYRFPLYHIRCRSSIVTLFCNYFNACTVHFLLFLLQPANTQCHNSIFLYNVHSDGPGIDSPVVSLDFSVTYFLPTVTWPWGKGGRCVRLTILPPSRAECHEIWEPKPPGTLWATPDLLRDCFTQTFTTSTLHFLYLHPYVTVV